MSPDGNGGSPAEKYQAFRQRQRHENSHLSSFSQSLPFALDDFQRAACQTLEAGRGVLVAAPTGAGKTIVGEFAVHLALAQGLKAFYTTPIKALSNQKFHELGAAHGTANVGLLTGDTSINPDAPVVVMTTEVLRNMLYADSPALGNLGYVVMDEVHYLADRFRGPVWEEVILHLPEQVRLVSLSATVSNAEEFGAWLDTVRGSTDVVVSEHRPVPLWQHVMAGGKLYDLFADNTTFDQYSATDDSVPVNPELQRLARQENAFPGRTRHRPGRDRRPARHSTSRPRVVTELEKAELLPAIYFIFSRAGCDAAVEQVIHHDLVFTTARERALILDTVDRAARDLPEQDLDALGFWTWREGLGRGVSAHHAGMLPAFKETVERLFSLGLVKAVFATETLALGINMPARSVVLEKLDKYNGQTHVDITPGEYTQFTGRAGRRGIDVEGHAVVLWQPGTDPAAVARLASRRSYPLNSSFKPTYNMAVNLLAQFGRRRTRGILESSFAQFQADKSVVGMARDLKNREASLASYRKSMACHLGDFEQYLRLRKRLAAAEKNRKRGTARTRSENIQESLRRLAPGDVLDIPQGRDAGLAVVLSPATRLQDPRPLVLTTEGHVTRLTHQELPAEILPLSWIRIPKGFNPRLPKPQRELLHAARQSVRDRRPPREVKPLPPAPTAPSGQDRETDRLREELHQHPCHGCPDREKHARWAERWWKLRTETDRVARKITGRTNTIAHIFDRTCTVLTHTGHLATGPDGEPTPTAEGEKLRKIYGETDLLTSLCVGRGVLDGLSPAALAATASALVYTARQENHRGVRPAMPSARIDQAISGMVRLWSTLDDLERQHGLPPGQEPDTGLVWPMFLWARGESLHRVLDGTDLGGGDFVRWVKQLVDLLDQIHDATDNPALQRAARSAVGLVRRGVVAHESTPPTPEPPTP